MTKIILLSIEFFKIALFTIGGGLAMIPLIEDIFVRKHKMLTKEDMLDMIALTQTIPGLISINAAVFVGNKLAGWKGSLVATASVILPSLLIIILIAKFFPLQQITNVHILAAFNCVRAAVLGMFIVLAIHLGKNILKQWLDFLLFVFFFCLLVAKISPVWIVLLACGLGGVYETWLKHKYFNGPKT